MDATLHGGPNEFEILIPKTMKKISKNAFADCKALSVICFGGTKEEWNMLPKEADWDQGTGEYSIIYDYMEI